MSAAHRAVAAAGAQELPLEDKCGGGPVSWRLPGRSPGRGKPRLGPPGNLSGLSPKAGQRAKVATVRGGTLHTPEAKHGKGWGLQGKEGQSSLFPYKLGKGLLGYLKETLFLGIFRLQTGQACSPPSHPTTDCLSQMQAGEGERRGNHCSPPRVNKMGWVGVKGAPF